MATRLSISSLAAAVFALLAAVIAVSFLFSADAVAPVVDRQRFDYGALLTMERLQAGGSVANITSPPPRASPSPLLQPPPPKRRGKKPAPTSAPLPDTPLKRPDPEPASPPDADQDHPDPGQAPPPLECLGKKLAPPPAPLLDTPAASPSGPGPEPSSAPDAERAGPDADLNGNADAGLGAHLVGDPDPPRDTNPEGDPDPPRDPDPEGDPDPAQDPDPEGDPDPAQDPDRRGDPDPDRRGDPDPGQDPDPHGDPDPVPERGWMPLNINPYSFLKSFLKASDIACKQWEKIQEKKKRDYWECKLRKRNKRLERREKIRRKQRSAAPVVYNYHQYCSAGPPHNSEKNAKQQMHKVSSIPD